MDGSLFCNGRTHFVLQNGGARRFATEKLIFDGSLDNLQRFDRTWPMSHSPLAVLGG